MFAAPHVAFRDCTHCQRYVYDESTGRPYSHPPGSGRLVPRPATAPPPCRIGGAGCPKGTPEDPLSLSHENQKAYRFDCECRAVGIFPDDPLVRRNAALIRAGERGAGTDSKRIGPLW